MNTNVFLLASHFEVLWPKECSAMLALVLRRIGLIYRFGRLL
jgi:hypothetical protein